MPAKKRKKQIRAFQFKIDKKATKETVDDNGIKVGVIEGYASVFGKLDSYKDTIMNGAFAKTLAERPNIVILADHRISNPIGITDEAAEDAVGLRVKIHVNLETTDGMNKYKLAKQGAIDGLSIGFEDMDSEYDRDTGIRKIKEIRLWEISMVTFPADNFARIDQVLAEGDDTEILMQLRVEHIKACAFTLESKLDDLADGDTGDAQETIEALEKNTAALRDLIKTRSGAAEDETPEQKEDTAPGKDHAAVETIKEVAKLLAEI